MNKMIEQVAKVIEELAYPNCSDDRCMCSGYQHWECVMGTTPDAIARAVIEAMREPTAEMCEASLKQDYADADKFGSYAGPIERWRAMIDEALK